MKKPPQSLADLDLLLRRWYAVIWHI